MADEKHVLILTASAGTGHNVAARAIEECFRAQAPELRVELLDVLSISNPFFRSLYAGGYLGLVRHAPLAMGLLYDAMDRPGTHLHEALRLAIQNANRGPTVRYLQHHRPHLVVNTHFLPAEVVAQMRRSGRLKCPQVTVTTDYETHRLWVQEPTERYYCATEEGKRYLTTWGVPAERVVVSGIPVRASFRQMAQREDVRRREGLDLARPLVLLMSGGFGVGPTAELLRELLQMPTAAQIVVITGRNETLFQRLSAAAKLAHRPVRVIGFTERMHEWMRAADVAVTKPGGLTVAEALVCGLPLVVVNPIPGQEARNSDYLLEHGAAIKVNNTRLLGHRVSQLLERSEHLAALRRAAATLGRPNAAETIVEDALRLL